jgi:F plasmid transfer operon protein
MNRKLLLMLAAMNMGFASADWYTRKLEGWYYFQEGVAEEEVLPYCPEDAMAILEEEKTKLQEALSLALLTPSQENIKNYVAESQRHLDRSAQFADAWGKALSDNSPHRYFLLFCFLGQDPLSAKAAETAKIFTKKYGWSLRAVSLDGAGVEGLESFECDQGISKAVDIRSTPSFYAVDPEQNKVIFLGGDSASLSDLEQAMGAQNE